MTRSGGGILVAIDSMTLVWGIRQVGTSEQLQRAKWLFQELEEDQAQIIVPSVALAEYLTAVEPRNHRDVIASLTERFQIHPFDVRCTSLAAKLFMEGHATRKKGAPGWRECLRADSLIIATAAVNAAVKFYSGDRDCRELAKKHTRMTVLDIPNMPHSLLAGLDPKTAIIRPKAKNKKKP